MSEQGTYYVHMIISTDTPLSVRVRNRALSIPLPTEMARKVEAKMCTKGHETAMIMNWPNSMMLKMQRNSSKPC